MQEAAFTFWGNDAAIILACQQGLLEINHYELLVSDRLIDSSTLLQRCVRSLSVNDCFGSDGSRAVCAGRPARSKR